MEIVPRATSSPSSKPRSAKSVAQNFARFPYDTLNVELLSKRKDVIFGLYFALRKKKRREREREEGRKAEGGSENEKENNRFPRARNKKAGHIDRATYGNGA